MRRAGYCKPKVVRKTARSKVLFQFPKLLKIGIGNRISSHDLKKTGLEKGRGMN